MLGDGTMAGRMKSTVGDDAVKSWVKWMVLAQGYCGCVDAEGIKSVGKGIPGDDSGPYSDTGQAMKSLWQ